MTLRVSSYGALAKGTMSPNKPNEISDLIERILDVTKSPQSTDFYQKVIAALGPGAVEMELGELRYQMKLGEVEDPARYFTKLLQSRIQHAGPQETSIDTNSQQLPAKLGNDKETYLSPSALELFEELRSASKGGEEKTEETALQFP